MIDRLQFYINGQWVDPAGETRTLDVINPATEQPIGRIALASAEDINRAVMSARDAFESFAATSKDDRISMLEALLAEFKLRFKDVGQAIQDEMGAPVSLAQTAQAGSGTQHIKATIDALKSMDFEEALGGAQILKEPVGVCGLITPWNWPANQIGCKVAPALAAGCTMVLKPSEIAPLDAIYWAEAADAAGIPAGVFNLVNGDGPTAGAALSAHPEVDMMSFTGSTRAGIEVTRAAAPTVKRVALELGGKSPNIILDDADLKKAVAAGAMACFHNTGQSCNAPTRMLVPMDQMEEAAQIAANAAAKTKVGDPNDPDVFMGPLSSEVQFAKVQALIQQGIDEGAKLAAGGPGKPDNLEVGYFVKPTVFANVTNEMTIAREEIFGPVLSIIGYKDEADAIRIANDTPYGLSSYIQSGDEERARRVGRQLRTGMVHINGANLDSQAPFGGYKQSGNGREWGAYGIEEFLETKSMMV